MPVTIEHTEGVKTVIVNERETPAIDKAFVSLGTYRFTAAKGAAVVVGTEKTDGHVVIDGQRVDQLEGVFASPVAASGHIYLIGRDGAVVVIKPAEKLEVVAFNRLDDRFDASPAVAGNDIFLRGHYYLYCIGVK